MSRRIGRSGPAIVIAVCAAIAGCKSPHDLRWVVDFETTELRDRAAVVRTSVRAGGCEGPERYVTTITRSLPAAMQPPTLAPGTWGFEATALDASCIAFANDCSVVTLPGNDVAVTLRLGAATTEVTECAPASCTAGICRTSSPDGGVAQMDGCTGVPGAIELCDSIDQDCDGLIDEGCVECTTGADCGTGEVCVGGRCGPECTTDADCGPGEACRGMRCGAPCASAVDCDAGVCAGSLCMSCPAGAVACSGACADLASDESNCGTCGNSCGARTCMSGACV